MTDEDNADVTQHDRRQHYRCPQLGGPVPFVHCRTAANGMPCARILACWEHVFDVAGFLAAHYDMTELAAVWNKPRKDKITSLIDLVRRARGESEGGSEKS